MMEVLRIKDRNELVFSFEDFCLLVREHMGDDAEAFLKDCPEVFSWDNAVEFDLENEKIADGYRQQIEDANELAGKLYQMILNTGLSQVKKYQGTVSELLQQVVKLKKVLVT